MLSHIRKHAQSWMIKAVMWGVVGGFVGTIFLVWGRGGDVTENGNIVATIDGDTITAQEYEAAYRNTVELYRQLYRGNLDPELLRQLNLRAQVLEDMINRRLVVKKARQMGLAVTGEELQRTIASSPAFSEGGRFSQRRYLSVLASSRISPQEYEAVRLQEMLIAKVEGLIKDSAMVSDDELWDYYLLLQEKVGIKFLSIDPTSLEGRVKSDEAVLTKYFQAQKERFRLPAKYRVQYLVYDPARFRVQPSEEQVQAYYEEHKGEFAQEKQVRLRQILIKTQPTDGQAKVEKARQQALEILDRARKGEDFQALARRYGQGPEAAEGGDLGTLKQGQVIKPIEDAVFGLKAGDLAPLVETQFGFHLLRVEQVKGAGPKPLGEVRSEISERLAKEKSELAAREAAEKTFERLLKKQQFSEAGKGSGVEPVTTQLFSEGEKVNGVEAEGFYAAARNLNPGQFSPLISTPRGYYLVKLLERQPSRLPEFREVREKVAAAYRKEESKRLAQALANDILKRLRAGEPWQSVAQKEGLKEERAGPFGRADVSVPGIGVAPELKESAFYLTPKRPYPERPFQVGDRLYIIAFERREEPPRGEFESSKTKFREQVIGFKKQQSWESWLTSLRGESKVKVLLDTRSPLQ